MSIINKLTEGIVRRDLSKEGAALLTKWEKTGLLEGLTNERTKHGMAALLENQAKQLLKEASTMQGGDVEGFASVAFPIVRRVFGGLIANDLVSVQPMSLPSGLIFFLDFTTQSTRLGSVADGSVYGGGVVGSQITGGVSLTNRNDERSFYSLNNGYSSPTGSADATCAVIASGTVGDATTWTWAISAGYSSSAPDDMVRYDPDLEGKKVAVGRFSLSDLTDTAAGRIFNIKDYVTITPTTAFAKGRLVRRLTRDDTVTAGELLIAVAATGTETTNELAAIIDATTVNMSFAIDDNLEAGGALGSVVGDEIWGLENQASIPEIDIKVDSVAVTAKTKKLKAKWTPELAQDLNAYHNLDAEVELTSVLSEHIALELDQEILEDLVKGATAGKLYWSRLPGKFVNRETGVPLTSSTTFPDFTGNVSEWYETLAETINDVSAQIHRKTLRGGANFIVCSPEVANLLEFTAGFRGSVTADDDRGTVGAVKVGSLSKKFDVYVDPYFPRNVVLCGRKGNSFLESGYVYAPYVPLQMTPTIFGTEDFVPRKGVMTRYAKKMVRPDMYGLVIVEDLIA
tara:strand:- start:8649 stop:10361 length:1713 start_codon:yes stop_codon:yes gene_type:complete